MHQQDAYRMIQRRAKAAGIETKIGNHTFRATGITAYLKNSGKLEVAQHIANHESPRTTKLYDRRQDEISLDNAESVRNHLQLTAERIERELGEERQLNRFEGSEQEWERQPLPDGPITVGIDGGYVRAAHKQGWFEVVAGKSVVAFRRDDEGEVPSAKCFGFVQTYDEKPRRRLWD